MTVEINAWSVVHIHTVTTPGFSHFGFHCHRIKTEGTKLLIRFKYIFRRLFKRYGSQTVVQVPLVVAAFSGTQNTFWCQLFSKLNGNELTVTQSY